jgi:hypothetical protein
MTPPSSRGTTLRHQDSNSSAGWWPAAVSREKLIWRWRRSWTTHGVISAT